MVGFCERCLEMSNILDIKQAMALVVQVKKVQSPGNVRQAEWILPGQSNPQSGHIVCSIDGKVIWFVTNSSQIYDITQSYRAHLLVPPPGF